jgi:hypothetical protein
MRATTPPRFVAALNRYRKRAGADPMVCFAHAGCLDEAGGGLRKAGIVADAFQFTGDYYCRT